MRSRRTFLLAGVLCALESGQAQDATSIPKPYLQVPTVLGEERTVRVFFSPACAYSRMYLPFFKNLAATLPSDKRLIYTPVVNKGDGVSYAMAYAAVERFYPPFLEEFMRVSMEAVQDRGIATDNWAGLERIGRASGIPVSLPALVGRHDIWVQKAVGKWVDLRHRLQVVNTPAVAVAGTYVVTPEITKGDASLFSQLVNGIISMAR